MNNVFSKRGELLLTSGSRNYPVGYSYDAQGRMKTMTNWSTFSAGAEARVTTWHYHPERGWLTNKVYADSQGTQYSYTDAGRLSTRLWAERGQKGKERGQKGVIRKGKGKGSERGQF